MKVNEHNTIWSEAQDTGPHTDRAGTGSVRVRVRARIRVSVRATHTVQG